MSKKSERAYWDAVASSERFDYYFCGLVAAVVAFVFRDIHPGKLSISPYGLKVLSLCILIIGVVYGLRRIEQVNVQKWLQHHRLYNQESVARLSDPALPDWVRNSATGDVYPPDVRKAKLTRAKANLEELRKKETEAKNRTLDFYRRRNWAFLVGTLGLVVAKLWAGYAPNLPR